MCGIAGMVVSDGRVSPEILARMRDALAHRGPDAAGLWVSPDGTASLAHRRLSILDLSEAARQPMADEVSGVRITFNGEIYNFQEVRAELEGLGHRFVTRSDTEVILKAYAQWGTGCLARLNGMFAFGIYDERTRQMFLARDRAGKKPLYYVDRPGYFAFASELKGLLADGAQPYCVDLDGLNLYFSYGYIPGERCILKEVRKLPPANALKYDLRTGRTEVWRYWTPPLPDAQGETPGEEALVDELKGLLLDSVRLRMISDVPLGVLLSGGVDSSLVAAAAATQSSRPVKTFTVTFPGEADYDESDRAGRIAAHFGTEHHELTAEAAGPDLLREMARQFDEPLADSSLLPTFLVSRLTRQHVTVALGGDGGDELFGGYGHYARAEAASRRYGWVPAPFWRLTASAASRLPAGMKGRAHLLSLRGGAFQTAIWGTPYFDPVLRGRLLDREARRRIGDGLGLPEQFKADRGQRPGLDAMMRLDFETYLPDDILAKVDRASMRVALEVRAPWLDHRIVEFAFGRVPLAWKVQGGITRRLQRALARQVLPAGVDLSRKQGFSIPLAQWLAGPWKPFVEAVLREASAPHVDWGFALRLWQGQQRGRSNGARLFALLMYELWWQAYGQRIDAG